MWPEARRVGRPRRRRAGPGIQLGGTETGHDAGDVPLGATSGPVFNAGPDGPVPIRPREEPGRCQPISSPPTAGAPHRPVRHSHPRRGDRLGVSGLAVPRPHPPPALRLGAAAQRRILPTDGVHDLARPRRGLFRHAARGRHAVTDPDHPRRRRAAGRRVVARRPPRPARPRGRDARRPPRGGRVATRSRSGGRGGVRHRQSGAPGRRPAPRPHRAGVRRRPGRGRAAGVALRLRAASTHAGGTARRLRLAGGGPGWWRSRPATPCTAPTTI